MPITRAVARPMLAGIFVASGIDAVRNPQGKAEEAEPVAEALGHPVETETMVRLNGLVQIGAGAMLASGRAPRLSALVLAGSLVPTTYAGHRFWEEDEPVAKAQQRTHFLKNVAILGGLILAAVDTEGELSLAKRTKRAVVGAPEALLDAARETTQDRTREAAKAAQEISKGATKKARQLSNKATKRAKRSRKAAKRAAANAAVLAAAVSGSKRGRSRSARRARKQLAAREQWVSERARTMLQSGTVDHARGLVQTGARQVLHSGAMDQAREGAAQVARAAGEQARRAGLPIAS